MFRTLSLHFSNLKAAASPAVRMLMALGALSLALAYGSASACTSDLVETAPAGAASVKGNAHLRMGPSEGLKLGAHGNEGNEKLISAYLPADGLSRSARQAEPAAPAIAKPKAEAASPVAAHDKPLAMLAAALVLMVSIALRRSGKR